MIEDKMKEFMDEFRFILHKTETLEDKGATFVTKEWGATQMEKLARQALQDAYEQGKEDGVKEYRKKYYAEKGR